MIYGRWQLTDLGVGFVSQTEVLDLTTPTGRAMTGMLAAVWMRKRPSMPWLSGASVNRTPPP
jgi:hypothetical protein